MKKIDVGIIGLGVGQWHLETYMKSNHVKNIFICDFKKNIEKKFFKISKNIYHSSFKEMLKNKNIKIISIASYDNYHFKQVLSSLSNNKNVFVEKPLCMFKHELKKIFKKQKKTKLLLSSNLVLRSNPLFQNIKKKINDGFFGKIFFIEGDYFWGRVDKFYGWRSKLKYYSKIYGAAIHMIDLITWMLGQRPKYVYAEGNKIGTKSKMKFNSFVILNLIFKNNLIVKITGNGPCVYPHFHGLKIFGSKKTFLHDHKASHIYSKKDVKKLNLKNSYYPAKKNRSMILKSFIEGVIKKNSRYFLADTTSVYNGMDICFAAEKSMISKKRIKITYTL
jgi:predicted dehydrogenase